MATISFEFSDKAYAVLEELAKWRDGRKVALFRAPTLIGKID